MSFIDLEQNKSPIVSPDRIYVIGNRKNIANIKDKSSPNRLWRQQKGMDTANRLARRDTRVTGGIFQPSAVFSSIYKDPSGR